MRRHAAGHWRHQLRGTEADQLPRPQLDHAGQEEGQRKLVEAQVAGGTHHGQQARMFQFCLWSVYLVALCLL